MVGMQAGFAAGGIAAIVLAGLAHLADRHRLRRSRLDQVGFMPWPTLAAIGTVGAIILFALALKSGA